VELHSLQWSGFKNVTSLKNIRKQSLLETKWNFFASSCHHGLGILMPVSASFSVFVVFLYLSLSNHVYPVEGHSKVSFLL
jgi:hypothetical protein